MGLAASRQEAFWEACGFGHIERVKKFLTEDIDVNWKSYTHDCCAIHVASQGKPEIVELLLEAGCDVNVKDDRGNLAIHHAAMKGHADILKTLIKAGSEINAQDKNGWSSLHCAAYWGHPKAVKTLIECGIDVLLQNKDQRTALHETARSKEENMDVELGEITRYLIEAGCDINTKSSDEGEADFTSLMFAAYHGHPEVAAALIDAGCELNSQGTNLWTALHWAADRQSEEVVYLLLEAGADPTCRGLRGELAADRSSSNPDLKEMLLNAINMYNELSSIGVVKSAPSSIATSPVVESMNINTNILTTPLVESENTDIESEAINEISSANKTSSEVVNSNVNHSATTVDSGLSESLENKLDIDDSESESESGGQSDFENNSDDRDKILPGVDDSCAKGDNSEIPHKSEPEPLVDSELSTTVTHSACDGSENDQKSKISDMEIQGDSELTKPSTDSVKINSESEPKLKLSETENKSLFEESN